MSVPESTINAIRNYCLYQERCHSEVRTKLLALSCYGEELEAAIGILIEEDMLNEERFARAYARGKFRMNHWGRKKIVQHLKAKKVSEYCIKKGLQEIDETEYWEVLMRVAEKKWASLKTERKPWMRQQKTQQYLYGRGFETDLSTEAIKTIAENH